MILSVHQRANNYEQRFQKELTRVEISQNQILSKSYLNYKKISNPLAAFIS